MADSMLLLICFCILFSSPFLFSFKSLKVLDAVDVRFVLFPSSHLKPFLLLVGKPSYLLLLPVCAVQSKAWMEVGQEIGHKAIDHVVHGLPVVREF